MESSDVIELNSSDEEAPAAKKMKQLSDVMVHIPSKLYETTITPTSYKQKGVGKSSCTKKRIFPNVHLQSTFKNKQNGRHLSKNISRPNEKKFINPLQIASYSKVNKSEPKSINLPPSITITKTNPATGLKNIIPSRNSYISVKKRKYFDIVPVKVRGASPQWYMRPEDQLNEESQELLNNKEPETTNMIEIIIEDSPIKLPNEPISDDLTHQEHNKSKSPVSKKKLDYPEKLDITSQGHETEPTSDIIFKTDTNNVEGILDSIETVEYQENPKTVSDESTVNTTLKVSVVAEDKSELDNHQNKVRTESVKIPTEKNTGENVGEFHPTYQKFIDLCFELENSDDMRKIVDKKIKTYYKQVSKEYVESEEFLNMVSVKMSLMRASPKDMFVYIKHIVDELNIQRKMVKSQETEINDVIEKETYDDQHANKERKHRRQIRKLEKTIKKLHRAIQKLEEQEVDFSDEENSSYVRTERYKERIVRVHAKLCQLTSSKMPSEPYIQIQPKPNEPQTLVKKLEKSINRKVPLGTPLPFPDFHDVLNIVRQVNEEEKLGWNETELMEEARDLFTRCGRKLQRRRQHNEWNLMTSRITQQGDPADDNETLKKKLDENRSEALKNEADLFKEFVDKQTELKLEGVEIGDKEADESPEESEDEEVNGNSNSSDNKSKQDRMLVETSKKSAESLEKSETSSRNKDVSKNVQNIYEKDKSPENTTEIVATDTSKDLMPTTSNQQISTCLNENESEAVKVRDKIVENNLATKVAGDIIKDNKVSNSETSTVLPSSVQLDDAKTRKSTDDYSHVTQRTNDPRSYSDFGEEINDPHAPIVLKSSDEAINTEIEYNMVTDNLSGDTTWGAAKIEDMERNNNPDAPIILQDLVQKKVLYPENHCSGDKDNISINVIYDSGKIEYIGKVINSPEIPAVLPSTIQNEKTDSKLQIEMDKDNLVTEVNSVPLQDEEESAKFKYNIHIDLVNDSDDDELNLLQKFHSGDELSLSSDSEAGSSNESHAICNSSQLGSEDEHDVISIENSSYSETESIIDDNFSKERNTTRIKNEVTYDLEEESQEGDHETAKSCAVIDEDDENDEDDEDVLLASSEDEDEDCTNLVLSKHCGNYVNLKDDDISISETQLIKVAPTNYHMDVTGECEISQSIEIETLCDENSNNSGKMINNDYLKTNCVEVILDD